MSRSRNLARISLTLVAGLATTACQNPESVRKLANMTAANVSSIRSGAAELAAESERVADARVRNLSRQRQANAQYRARLELDRALLAKAGQDTERAIADLAAWFVQVDQIFAVSEDDDAAFRAELTKARVRIDTRSKELAGVARLLSELGEEESFKDRLGFFAGYLKGVRDEVEKRRAANDATVASAEKALAEKEKSE